MQCTQCNTRNPDSFKFCRECGGKFPAAAETTVVASDAGTVETVKPAVAFTPKPKVSVLAEEEAAQVAWEKMQGRVAGLLTAAFALTEQRKYNEAIPIAEEAIKLLPNSTSAHALLATLYERTHQNPQAIAAMERVVELNPESEADQVKLDQLRRGVHVMARPAVVAAGSDKKQPQWMPALLSIGCGAAVLGVGLYLVNVRLGSSDRAAVPLPSAAPNDAATLTPQPSLPQVTQQTPQTPSAPMGKGYVAPPLENREDPFVSASGAVKPSPAPTTPVQSASAGPGLPRLPAPGDRRASAASPTPTPRFVPPVTFGAPPKVSTRGPLPALGSGGVENTALPPVSDNRGFGSGSRLSVGPPPANSGENNGIAPQPQQPNPNSYIRIEVKPPSSGAGNTAPVSRPSSPTVSAPAPVDTNPLARARRLQGAGRYSDAVAAYREAGSGGDAQQGMAQCYERLGDEGAARNAYRSALRAYEAQRGSASAQRGIASCKAALEVLGG